MLRFIETTCDTCGVKYTILINSKGIPDCETCSTCLYYKKLEHHTFGVEIGYEGDYYTEYIFAGYKDEVKDISFIMPQPEVN